MVGLAITGLSFTLVIVLALRRLMSAGGGGTFHPLRDRLLPHRICLFGIGLLGSTSSGSTRRSASAALRHPHDPRARRAAAVTRAVVFAYHDVGVRCLSVLLARGVDVALVITHETTRARRSGSTASPLLRTATIFPS